MIVCIIDQWPDSFLLTSVISSLFFSAAEAMMATASRCYRGRLAMAQSKRQRQDGIESGRDRVRVYLYLYFKRERERHRQIQRQKNRQTNRQ